MEPIIPKVNEASLHGELLHRKPQLVNPEYQELAEMSDVCIESEWGNCQKRQGHEGFIPLLEFISKPEYFLKKAKLTSTERMISYVMAMADITVRLEVKNVSNNRPKLYTKLYEHRGKIHIFTGSGCIVHEAKESKHPCRCITCRKMKRKDDKAVKKTFSIYIATATHIVYDDEEAKNMIAELHYNNDAERGKVKKLYGISLCERNVYGDSCVVECVTCDEQLANEIKTQLNVLKELYREFPRSDEPNVVIISHPHGKPKHISFGQCKESHEERNVFLSLTSFEYNATTCPGSSGAPVLLMNDKCTFRGCKFEFLNCPAHCGVNSEGRNFSAASSNPTLKKEKETLVSEKKVENNTEAEKIPPQRVEADVDEHFVVQAGCRKNPGHPEFIPVNDFNINHLPAGCRDEDLVEVVKALSDLTVCVAVTMVSPYRPEFFPVTKQPYPFYGNRGSDCMRIGTGVILLVRQIDDWQQTSCNCYKCQHSDTPSKVSYDVYLKTATHVVFDKVEARHTTARIFFDSPDSPLVTLDGWQVVDSDIEGDTCYLKCVTCDVNLLDKLKKMNEHLWGLFQIIGGKYKSEKIAIILSHPHGCPKQVSVGHEVDYYSVSETYDSTVLKHTYTTCTCPGSSGAAVCILSKDVTPFVEKYVTHHVHSDALENGFNKCSLAVDKFI